MLCAKDEQVFRQVVKAARAGKACPTNFKLADMLGWSTPSTASEALHRLERSGLVQVERHSTTRIVTIVETGESTTRPIPKARRYHKAEHKVVNPPEPVKRDPCFRCGVRGDLHGETCE